MRRVLPPACVLAGLWLGAAARAQEQPPPQEGPVVVGVLNRSLREFELERFEAVLDLYAERRVDRVRMPDGTTQVDKETRFRETLDLFGQASVGHKNLLDLTATVQFGLEQRDIRSETAGLNTRESDTVSLYDISALILGSGRLPLTLYARREQSVLDRAFAGSIDDTLTETGAIAQFRSEIAPTTVQYFHRVHEQSDPLGRGDTSVTQDTFTLQSGIRLTDASRLDITYTFDHINEDQGDFFSDGYDRHDANIVHTWAFGGELRPHELRSSLRLTDQSGRFDQRSLRLDELLVLHHSDRLETRYALTLDQETRGGAEQRLYRGEASIRHRLFESLVSSATIGGQRVESPDNAWSDDLFASGVLDYTKKVPLGRFNAAAGVSYNAQHNSERGSTLAVLNEPRVFNDPFPIALSRRNIEPASIVVTPVSGFPVYLEGIDYTVQVFPDRAELRVPPGSAISDGQTVLVSYDVGPEPASDIDTLGTTLSFRYSLTEGPLTGLSVYTTYRTVDYTVSARDPSLFVVDDFRSLLVGVGYVRAGFDLTLEHESRDSNIDPFESNRLLALYQMPLGRASVVSVQYSHDDIDYSRRDNRVVFDRITGRWDQQVNPSLRFNVRLEYRNERNDLSGDSEGFDQILGFSWHRGQTTVYGSFRNAFLNGEGTDTDSQRFQVGLRRSF